MNLPITAALLAVCSFTVCAEGCKDIFTQFRADIARPFPNSEKPSTNSRDGIDCQSRIAQEPQPPAGPVSFYKLTHKIPNKARKEFVTAIKLEADNKSEEGIEHLRKAIAIDPNYMEAYNNLGSRLMTAGRTTEAIEALNHAAMLDPTSSFVHSNLGVVYLSTKNLPEAERQGRLAVALDPTSAKSRYVLGMSLAMQGKEKASAIFHLKLAVTEIPAVERILNQLK